MIVFVPASALPHSLMERDLVVLAQHLSRKLRTSGVHRVGIKFVSEKTIQGLNKQYRRKNRSTDVLSFASAVVPFIDSVKKEQELGDVVICSAYAQREAKRRHIPFREEYIRLVTHGVLHLSGYDHATEDDEMKMFALQESVVEKTQA